MKLNKKVLKRAGCWILLLFTSFSLMHLRHQRRHMDSLFRDIWVLEQDVAKARGLDIDHAMNTLQRERDQRAGEVLRMTARIPSALTPPEILLLLTEAAQGSIERQQLLFLEEIRTDAYHQFPVRITFDTQYSGLLMFLARLDALHVPVTVEHVVVSVKGVSAPLTENVNFDFPKEGLMGYTIHVVMTVNFYQLP